MKEEEGTRGLLFQVQDHRLSGQGLHSGHTIDHHLSGEGTSPGRAEEQRWGPALTGKITQGHSTISENFGC